MRFPTTGTPKRATYAAYALIGDAAAAALTCNNLKSPSKLRPADLCRETYVNIRTPVPNGVTVNAIENAAAVKVTTAVSGAVGVTSAGASVIAALPAAAILAEQLTKHMKPVML
jgi:hypothetical protein